jgi:hypothetical protein
VSPLGGDEPHYVIIADAIARDHSMRVRTAYARDELEKLDWQNQTQTRANGTFSLHNIGIAALIAPAFRWFGVRGARVMLAAVAGCIPFLFFGIARTVGIRRGTAAGLAFCCSLSLPFLVASAQMRTPGTVTATACCSGSA